MRTIRVVTRCTTKDEFLAAFARFVDGNSLFVVTRKPLPVGPRRRFLIQLKNEQTMLSGEAEVVASITDRTGVGGRNGMRIKMVDMDGESHKVHTALLEAARFADGSAPAMNVAQKGKPSKFPTKSNNNKGRAAPALVAAQPVRAPSPAYTLPANPFGELDHAALEQFVECTLYEEAGTYAMEDDGWSEPPQMADAGQGLAPTAGRTANESSGGFARPTSPTPLPKPVPGLAPSGKGLRVKRGSEVGYSTEEEITWYGEEPRSTVPEPFAADTPKRNKGMLMIIGGAVAGATIFGLLVGYLVGSSDDKSGNEARREVMAAGKVDEPSPGEAKDEPQNGVEPPAEPAIKKPATAVCTAHITTVPPGVDVSWAGESLGKTPLVAAPVRCGQVSVFFSHSRYRNVSVKSSAELGAPVKLSRTMVRMRAQLTLRSIPRGAVFRVKGRRVGKSPAKANVPRYTQVVVEATLKGHKKWRKQIFVKGEKQVVRARLRRGKRSFKKRGRR